jgi:hypothetical protein
VKFVKFTLGFSSKDRRFNRPGYSAVLKPLCPAPVPVQQPVLGYECLSGCKERISGTGSYGSVQPPGQENGDSFAMDVRQSSSVFVHFSQGRFDPGRRRKQTLSPDKIATGLRQRSRLPHISAKRAGISQL